MKYIEKLLNKIQKLKKTKDFPKSLQSHCERITGVFFKGFPNKLVVTFSKEAFEYISKRIIKHTKKIPQ